MVLRTSKNNANFKFYGCKRFPKCRGMVNVESLTIEKPKLDYSGIVGSTEQTAFWQAVKDTTAHLILQARAGSGKTFTITYILSFLINVKIAFFAFNRHIAAELKNRVPQGVLASTLHSYGFAQIKRWNPRAMVNENKLAEIIANHTEDEYLQILVRKVAELCKANLYTGTRAEIDQIVIHYGIETNDHSDELYRLTPLVIQESKRNRNVIDYTDMLWFVIAHNIPVEQFDVVIADEIQDFNPLQRAVAFRAMGNTGRFIGVGDDRQAIYGFAGASVNSMQEIITDLEKTMRGVNVLPLTYTRRSPQSHVALAQGIVPDIKSLDNAELGSIERLALNAAIDTIQVGDMGICRRNAPLINVAYTLLRNNIPVLVKGRDIGKGIKALIRKMKATDIEDLINKAENYRDRELNKLRRKDASEAQITSLNDKVDTLIALTDGLEDISEVIARIDHLFSDEDTARKVILSTVHKAKGLEAKTVYIFDYSNIRINVRKDWQILQEANLHYIALTRSTDRLYLVD